MLVLSLIICYIIRMRMHTKAEGFKELWSMGLMALIRLVKSCYSGGVLFGFAATDFFASKRVYFRHDSG